MMPRGCARPGRKRVMETGALFVRAIHLEHHRGDDDHDLRRPRARFRLRLAALLARDGREPGALRAERGDAGIARIDAPDALDIEHPRLRGRPHGREAGDEHEKGEKLAEHGQ